MVLISPYPLDRLPLVGREELERTRRLVRALDAPWPAAASRLGGGLLGDELRVRPGVPEALAGLQAVEALVDPLVAVVLRAPEQGATMLVEVHPGLATAVVDRALGGEGGAQGTEAVGPLGDAERGVLAYVAARLLGEAGAARWRVATVLSEAEAARALVEAADEALAWPLDVRLGRLRAGARLWLLGGGASTGQGEAPQAHLWAALPLDVVLEAGRAELAAEELSDLQPGDVLVLDDCGLRPEGEAWRGSAWLAVAGSRRRRWEGHVGPEGFRIDEVRRAPERAASEGRVMQEDVQEEAGGVPGEAGADLEEALVAAGDAPVTLSVELARFTLSLEEVAALRPGEIVATGQEVGRRVVLRVGDQAVAVGELVDVEGEIGVRIHEIGG